MTQKRKRGARVRKLEGRVVEKAIIRYGDPNASQPEDIGPCLELHMSGGIYFSFTAQIKPTAVQAEVFLAQNKGDNFDDHIRATITDIGWELL